MKNFHKQSVFILLFRNLKAKNGIFWARIECFDVSDNSVCGWSTISHQYTKKKPENTLEEMENILQEESDFSEDELGEEEELGSSDEELGEEDFREGGADGTMILYWRNTLELNSFPKSLKYMSVVKSTRFLL